VSIVGENKRPGIILENVKNIRIENVRIIRCSYGIKIVSSKNVTFSFESLALQGREEVSTFFPELVAKTLFIPQNCL